MNHLRKNLSIWIKTVAVLVLFAGLLSGCGMAGRYMIPSETISQPDSGKVLVSFVRPSSIGMSITFGIFENEEAIGIMAAKKKIHYVTTPGEHFFVARAENWAGLQATFEPNRHYVINVEPQLGTWKARVTFKPITTEDYADEEMLKKVKRWLKKYKAMQIDPSTIQDFTEPRRAELTGIKSKFMRGLYEYQVMKADDYLPE